ncbi:glycosyltransferase family 25 protein [Hypomontagnella submonticulosa]|nr:glycosyltransferase family 25 protein [Hypomontagnella submonticulosa]
MTLPVSLRRVSYPVLIAISALLVVSFYLLSTKGDGVPYLNTVRATSLRPNLRENIYNNTLGFEKIFVIALPSRTDRRDGMVLQAALSNLQFEFVDGVDGKTISDSAIPSSQELERVGDATLGAWRAHINAIQEVVKRNLSSALIMEDDADWDVRIKQQMYDFALATNALTQPLSGSSGTSPQYADATYPEAGNGPSAVPDIQFDGLPSTVTSTNSPYGDNWDVIWAGHCGMHFPYSDKRIVPKGRVVRTHDNTVPQRKYLWSIFKPEDLELHYEDHTRVYHHVQEGVCSLAYAITQKGARRLLYELGLKDANTAFDIELRWFCDGTGNPDRGHHNCLTVQPSLFQIHLPAGPKKGQSDISDHGDGLQEKMTKVLRYSVRMNAEALMDGRLDELVDQWPD